MMSTLTLAIKQRHTSSFKFLAHFPIIPLCLQIFIHSINQLSQVREMSATRVHPVYCACTLLQPLLV